MAERDKDLNLFSNDAISLNKVLNREPELNLELA
jgi:hypothetical protein